MVSILAEEACWPRATLHAVGMGRSVERTGRAGQPTSRTPRDRRRTRPTSQGPWSLRRRHAALRGAGRLCEDEAWAAGRPSAPSSCRGRTPPGCVGPSLRWRTPPTRSRPGPAAPRPRSGPGAGARAQAARPGAIAACSGVSPGSSRRDGRRRDLPGGVVARGGEEVRPPVDPGPGADPHEQDARRGHPAGPERRKPHRHSQTASSPRRVRGACAVPDRSARWAGGAVALAVAAPVDAALAVAAG